MHRRLIILAALLATTASSQMLDLSRPQQPGPGDGPIVLRTARELLETSSDLLKIDTPSARARSLLRRVAARAIRQGDQAEPNGSSLTLLGFTMPAHFAELDQLLESATPPIAHAVASDLKRLLAESPDDVRQWEQAIQFALSPLISDGLPSAWITVDDPAATDSLIGELESLRDMLASREVAQAVLARLMATIETARTLDRWPSYSQSIHTELSVIARAGRALRIDEPWLTQAARDRLLSEFSLAMRDDAARARRDRLRVIALEARLLSLLSQLPRDGVSRDLRERFVAGIVSRSARPTQLLESLPLAIEILERAERIEELPQERELVRELRLIQRALVPEVRRRAKSAQEAAAVLAASPDEGTDPGTLAAIAAFIELSDLAESLATLNQSLAADSGGVVVELQAVADRLLSLGRDAQESSTARETAFETLVTFIEQRSLTSELAELLTLAIGRNQSSEQLTTLVGRTNTARASWAAAWSIPGGGGLTQDQIIEARSLRRLLLAMADLRAEMTDLNARPWWELPNQQTDSAEPQLERVTRRFLAGTGNFQQEIARFESDHATQLLAGRLARTTPAIDRSILEIAGGAPPREALFESTRDQLATVCRYAIELSSESVDASLKPYIASIALPLRDALPRIAPQSISSD